ncbi:MAG TPA: class I SAM-dependent methyltransferase [Bacteroidales bacterium]|jgi:predicted O-methyltransferase YrrM|nr:class I SAM-dependent methyltransferase [Bacteroidales bacterium]HPM88390.1 class I SAM-dependent methyltransferase [Bacteroidales bacterium]HQM69279.1 class I SAM-dependent methyltransferase [Bacteroidales bacterium]
MDFMRILKYLHYHIFSRHKRGHGIHSPFVFDLVSRVFRNKTDPEVVLMIERIRKELLCDKRTIRVLDLGSGSALMKSDLRRISDIAKYTSVPAKYGVLLANLAAEFGRQGIVEFGTSLGISTMYMASAYRDSRVFTMEGCPEISTVASDSFRRAGFGNITLMTGSFDDLLPKVKSKVSYPGLVFIDGNHRKEPVLRYFSEMVEVSGNKTVIVIDDIHSSDEMEEAWNEIKANENVSFTIDLYRMGLVFFRKGMSRFDYVIRY